MPSTIGLITTNYSCEGLSELTRERPAAALPFNGRYRLIDFALSNMVNGGIEKLGVILPPSYRALVDHLGSGKDWMLDRKHAGLFLLPGSPFGRVYGGPRFLLRDMIDNHRFFDRNPNTYLIVSGSNIVYSMDFSDLVAEHAESGADITMLATESSRDIHELMGVNTDDDGNVIGFTSGAAKGDMAFLDCFVVKTDYLRQLLVFYKDMGYLNLFEAIAGDLDHMTIRIAEYTDDAMAVFTTDDYYKSSMRVLDTKILDTLFDYRRPIYTKSHDNPPAKYMGESSAKRCIVSEGTVIEGTVEHSVLGRNVIVAKGATVKDSVIMQHCTIGPGATVKNAILDRNNVVPARTKLVGTEENILIEEKESVL